MRKKIKFPEWRQDLIDYLYHLSDIPFQKRKWVNHKNPYAFYEYFGYAIDSMEDHGLMDDNPEPTVGLTFRTEEEIILCKKVGRLVHEILEMVGRGTPRGRGEPDHVYLNSPLWPKLAEAAKEAFELCSANDRDCGYVPPFPYSHDTSREVLNS